MRYDLIRAQALAYAFLDGDWSAEGLMRRGTLVIGQADPNLRRLVRRVLRAYPRPPWDRGREFRDWIAANRAFDDLPLHLRRPVRWLPYQPAMGEIRWPVPAVPTTGELAHFLDLTVEELLWFADVKSFEARISDEALRHYRYRWVRKASGGWRLIESPKPRLREIQRLILGAILNHIPAHEAAHGFIRGRSAITFARVHVGAPVIVRMDLENFFTSISAARVYGVFRTAGYPESVAHLLAGLSTNAMPRSVWQAPDAPGDYMLGRQLGVPHLPQGSPTSPSLANLCAHGLDRRLAGLAGSFGLRYSRYADDLAFSGDIRRPAAARVIEMVREIALDEGFRVREDKTVVAGRGHRQRLAGIVVNRTTNVDRPSYDRLRATLHNATRNGLQAENRAEHPHFLAYLRGRSEWVGSLNEGRDLKLKALIGELTSQSGGR